MKKKKFILPVFLKLFFYVLILTFNFLLLTFVNSAFEQKPPAARPIAMGGAFVGLSNDTNAIDYNPAGLRLIPAFQFSSTYTDLYGVEGLGYTQAKFAFPVAGFGDLGFYYSDFGPPEYKESVFMFSQGVGLAEGIMFGYNLKSMGLKIKEYGSDSAFGLDIAMLSRISEDFGLGISAKNINEPEISKGHEKLTEEFTPGLFYRPLPGLNFGLDFEKVIDQPVAVHTGVEFRVTDFFVFRTGLQTNPSKYALGFGINYDVGYLDYAYSTHATLDGMHVISLSMKFGGEKEASLKYAPKRRNEKRATRKREDNRPAAPGEVTEETTGFTGKVNINTASADDIAGLPGMGKVMAKRIVDYRTEKGPFKSIEDILNVPRMTRRVYSKIEPIITIEAVKEKTQAVPAAPSKPSAVTGAGEEEMPPEEEANPNSAPEKTAPPSAKPAAASVPAPVVQPAIPAPAPAPSSTGKININDADISQLKDLGFTTVQSQNILRYIKKNGPLPSVNDLKNVPGISADIVDEVKDNITVK